MFRILKWLVAGILTVFVAAGGVVVLATYDELTATLPPIDRLLEYDPPVATRVYAADGSLIEEFFRERRYRVPIGDIPPMVRNAFLAAEDSDFYAHRGVDFIGIARAFLVNLRSGEVVQGASTITQQVVKALLLTPERSYERKLKEILLSLRLEQQLSKEEILELYLNQIYFGDGNHGVGAAARNYFGKSVQELTVAEAALLAGLPAAPSRYSPNRNAEAAKTRQHYVLRRMLEERFLSAGEYQAAMREQVVVHSTRGKPVQQVRNYYTESVRLKLEEMFGAEAPYNQGYTVHTAMQPRLQDLAEVAIRSGIEKLDQSYGYRGPLASPAEAERQKHIAKTMEEIAANGGPDPERLYEAVVTAVSPGKLEVVVGESRATVELGSLRWHWTVKDRKFQAGDLVQVRCRETGHATPQHRLPPDQPVKWRLAQTPQIEAALVAIDMEAGGIAAMVGGYDFMASQFNRALQAKRQPGSAFKPFVYAAALDHGFTPASILQDTPVEYKDNDKVWIPRNYTRDYKGPIRLRTALEQSRNVVSVKLVDSVGVRTVVDYLARFRLNAEFGPNLSLGLGTTELTLRDLTEGYTAFANGGVKVEPVIIRRIEDKDGHVFFNDEPRRRESLSPQTAALMTYLLEGVVERGTATSIKALGRPVAGKTGTTNEARDAWFIGYTPTLTVGVWVGFDDQTMTMGKTGTGGRLAAPIWLDFMKPALAGTPVRDFEIPDAISCVNIDPNSGKRAREWTAKPLLECFKEGTEPGFGVEGVYEADGETPRDGSPPATLAYEADEAPVDGSDPNASSDPRWPTERDAERLPPPRWLELPDDRSPDPPGFSAPPPGSVYVPQGKLRAESVPGPRGPEVRLYRDSEVPEAAPPSLPPVRLPSRAPSAAAPRYDRLPPSLPPPDERELRGAPPATDRDARAWSRPPSGVQRPSAPPDSLPDHDDPNDAPVEPRPQRLWPTAPAPAPVPPPPPVRYYPSGD